MSLDDWSRAEEGDTGRAKRMAGSYAAAMIVVAAVLGVGMAFGGQIKKQVFEEEVEVKFVPPEPVKAAPPPPPPPPPPPAPKVAMKAAPKGAARQDAPPKELPKGPPEEGDPNKPKEEVAVGDPNGVIGGTGRGGSGTVVAPIEPPAPPPPAPVVQVAEVSTQPIPISKAMPAYPEDARKQGVEALVVVKFIVTETGQVEDAKVIKGHPLFDDVVLANVRTWTFQPATIEGKPVRMVRMVKIPFRLRP
ncbi:MAG TPA: TonB family protein [Labilithrix sp.]|nr:TonB family protein [Labilithrix sp.]